MFLLCLLFGHVGINQHFGRRCCLHIQFNHELLILQTGIDIQCIKIFATYNIKTCKKLRFPVPYMVAFPPHFYTSHFESHFSEKMFGVFVTFIIS
jgi:hypothetical protein